MSVSLDIVRQVIEVQIVQDQVVQVQIWDGITIMDDGVSVGTTRTIDFISGSNVTISAEKLGTKIKVTVNSTNSGVGSGETLASLGTILQTAADDSPLDADTFNFYDAVAAILRKVTWTNIKASLKAYFDTIYDAMGTAAGLVASTITAAQKYTVEALADANYTLQLSDFTPLVKYLTLNSASNRTITLPNNTTAAIPIGQGPVVLLNLGSGTYTIAAEAGATVENFSGTLTMPPGSIATFIKRAINTWRVENITSAVPTSRTIAGVDLVDNITAAELLVALGLGTKVTMTADFALTSTTYVDNAPSSGPVLSFSVTNGVAVEIFAFIIATTSDGNGGMGISTNGPSLTSYFSQILIPTSATSVVSRSGTTYGAETVSASILTTGGISVARFRLLPSASGTVILRHSCETAVGHTITIKAGSYAIAI